MVNMSTFSIITIPYYITSFTLLFPLPVSMIHDIASFSFIVHHIGGSANATLVVTSINLLDGASFL